MKESLSFAAGLVLAGFNLAGLAFFVSRLGVMARPMVLAGYALLLFLKLGATLAALFFIVRSPWFKPFPLLAGLSLPVAGVFMKQMLRLKAP
jgi:hypothetical protein